jgi:hypothetical protein
VLPRVAKDSKGWLKDVFDSNPIWYGGFGNPPLKESLLRLFPWSNDDRVFFLVRRGTGYESPWPVYVAHCESFLGWYDEGLLFHPTAREVAAFREVRAVFVGRHSERHLLLRGAG